MQRIELELDEKTLARARELAERRQCSLDQLIKDFIDREARPAASADTVLGMFADEPDMLDEIVASAMHARERDPLRQAGG